MIGQALTVYGPEVGKSGLTASLDAFVRQETGLEIIERFFSIHSRASIEAFYSLTGSTSGAHWPLVLDLFDMRPACVTIWQGADALSKLQRIKGNTQPTKAAAGTIRSRFYCDNPVTNLIHVSDSQSIMKRELQILEANYFGTDDEGWENLASGQMSHSAMRVLLAVLGDDVAFDPTALNGNDSAVGNTLWALERVERLTRNTEAEAGVHAYLAGEPNSVERLIGGRFHVCAWDYLLLRAGLHAVENWKLLRRSLGHTCFGGHDVRPN